MSALLNFETKVDLKRLEPPIGLSSLDITQETKYCRIKAARVIVPVSYTHLDVYKRQDC